MAINYELIESNTLATTSSSITFSSLGSYNDLEILFVGSNTTSATVYYTFNNDTGAKYNLTGNSASVGQGVNVISTVNSTAMSLVGYKVGTGTSVWRGKIYIPEYRNTTFRKNTIQSSVNRNGNQEVLSGCGEYQSTSAITSITFSTGTAFAVNTNFQIYGIKVD